MGIDDRVVRRLQPYCAAMGIDPFEAIGHVLAAAQLVPERLVTCRVCFLRFTEHAVMLAAHLLKAIPDRLQETVVGGQHLAIQVEFDHGGRTHQRLDQAFVFA